ncbi:hypothetical protein G7Z17_g5835 [Cylindrodendrum hubeiense]|uniref:Uncharacterized protein n=1 Tax=Cylindrodendrum hubeiense TaxID=595255 RepID=A0A9P5HBC3_9HYPO|nr:hypothetical protein G7Z17_g5835 [Cylindrodendrum hubeiense]
MVAYLNNKEQSSFGDDVLEVLQVASTLWPISFAAVAGPCLKTLALHRAEQGSSIGYLEFLLTSQTIVAALKNLFTVRHITAWSIGAWEHLAKLPYPDVDFELESKLELVVGGRCDGDDPDVVDWTLQICDISTSYVDIQVACTRLSPLDDLTCQAARVRNTPGFPIAGNLTAVSSFRTISGIIWELPFVTASDHLGEASVLETYLLDPTHVFKRMTSETFNLWPGCFLNVSLDVFGARMATALNTAIMAMCNSSVLTGGDGISLKDRNRMWHDSTATWTEFIESKYVIHKAWFSVSLASTLVLFCLSLVNVVIRCLIKAPDCLEGVAGLTRDSQYIRVPQEGSGMSGSDRLQMIKGTKVRICDVNPDSEVGRIALTTNVDSPKLDWRRTYRYEKVAISPFISSLLGVCSFALGAESAIHKLQLEFLQLVWHLLIFSQALRHEIIQALA